MTKKKVHEIGAITAIINSICGKPIAYFPRLNNDGRGHVRIQDWEIFKQIGDVLDELNVGGDRDVKAYIDRGRETLNEVKALTEYQDQKMTRLLTIMAFLTALAGVLFSKFADQYPIHVSYAKFGWSAFGVLIGLTYVVFCVFALSAVCGALVGFHATKTTFKFDDADAATPSSRSNRPKSYIFYKGILRVTPDQWARAFTSTPVGSLSGTELDIGLQLQYLKNYVGESYLVAAKVADKLRYLEPAQKVLAFAVKMLLLWIALLAITTALVSMDSPVNATWV